MNLKFTVKIIHIFAFILLFLPAVAQDSVSWGLVRIPVACIRDGKGHSTEMTSQAIMGTPLQILDTDGDWHHIISPDGYEGYMNISSVAVKSADEIGEWRRSKRLVSVSVPEIKVYSTPEGRGARDVVSEFTLSAIVEGTILSDTLASVTLPDGRRGYADARHFVPAEKWASADFDMKKAMDIAYSLMGTPYLWGACSTKSVDCSGLVRVAYFSQGVLTLRDARQQIEIGKRIGPEQRDSLMTGDLLFFSNTPDGRISHVAIFDHDDSYIHSSGLVKTNRMRSDDPDFGKRYYRGASRIVGMEDSKGITKMINHPWYFEK